MRTPHPPDHPTRGPSSTIAPRTRSGAIHAPPTVFYCLDASCLDAFPSLAPDGRAFLSLRTLRPLRFAALSGTMVTRHFLANRKTIARMKMIPMITATLIFAHEYGRWPCTSPVRALTMNWKTLPLYR